MQDTSVRTTLWSQKQIHPSNYFGASLEVFAAGAAGTRNAHRSTWFGPVDNTRRSLHKCGVVRYDAAAAVLVPASSAPVDGANTVCTACFLISCAERISDLHLERAAWAGRVVAPPGCRVFCQPRGLVLPICSGTGAWRQEIKIEVAVNSTRGTRDRKTETETGKVLRS